MFSPFSAQFANSGRSILCEQTVRAKLFLLILISGSIETRQTMADVRNRVFLITAIVLLFNFDTDGALITFGSIFKRGFTPRFKVPEFKVPEFKVPEFQVPEFKVPEFKVPEFKVSEFKVPEYKIPEYKINTNELILPELEAPIPQVESRFIYGLESAKDDRVTSTKNTVKKNTKDDASALLSDGVNDENEEVAEKSSFGNELYKLIDYLDLLTMINNYDDDSSSTYKISNAKITKLSESLFKMDKNNAYKYIHVNLQGKTRGNSTGDNAPSPLLYVRPEAYEIPTIKSVLALHDNYELDSKVKETVTSEERDEESALLDRFLETGVFKAAMKFLVYNGFMPSDQNEIKNILKRIWFTQFEQVKGVPFSSGFEAVFVAEKFGSFMVGPQNWIYFAKQEARRNLDYYGYIKDVKFGSKAEMIKARFAFNIPGTEQSVTTLLVGLSPELEMALYTVCFYVYPNNVCPISLNGKDVALVTAKLKYFEKDILIAGFVTG